MLQAIGSLTHLIELLVLRLVHLLGDLVDSTWAQNLRWNHNSERFVDQDVLSLAANGACDHMATLAPSPPRANILPSAVAQDPVRHIASVNHNRRCLYHVTGSSGCPSCILIIVVCQLEVGCIAGSVLVRDQLLYRYVLVGVHFDVLRRTDYVAHFDSRVA